MKTQKKGLFKSKKAKKCKKTLPFRRKTCTFARQNQKGRGHSSSLW